MTRRWPVLTLLAVDYLNAELDARVLTVLPAKLAEAIAEHGGVVRVTRGPGSDDKNTDTPLLDVEVFHNDDRLMWDLAEDVREAMHRLAGKAVGARLVDTVTTSSSPTYVEYGTAGVRRAVASYRIAFRKSTVSP